MEATHHNPDFKRYLVILAVTALICIAGEIALVLVVDPYRLYGLVAERKGFNTVKPSPDRYQNEIKLTQAERAKADVLIFGNSRAEIGFDPEAPALVSRGLSGYNMAIAGTTVRLALKQLNDLGRKGVSPKAVLLGVEFLDFKRNTGKKSAPAGEPGSPIADSNESPVDRFFWKFDSLFSFVSLKDAVLTILIQHRKNPETWTARGFNPLNSYLTLAAHDGYYKLFRQRAEENAKSYRRKAGGEWSEENFRDLAELLDQTGKNGTGVKIVVYPYHAQILLLFEETGLWQDFAEWKRRILAIVDAAKAKYPASAIELYDFSGYSEMNCERIPAKGDRKTSTRWYWELGHFKRDLGNLVLDRVFGGDGGTGTFGVRLDGADAARNEERIWTERARCEKQFPELFAETKELVRRTG